jgi:F-type H+-transporting ATPase subunit b
MSRYRLFGIAAAYVVALAWGSVAIGQETGAAHAPETAEAETGDAHAAAAGAAHDAAGHAAGPNPMAFGPDLAIFSMIVFLLLLAILSWFAWPQIVAALDERERKIADNIRAAEQKHEDAKRLLVEHEAKLSAAAGEVRALLDEARRDAEHTKSSIVADARKAADDEKVRALRDIERAKDGAIHELAIASANVAVDLAGKVIRDKLTPEQNNQLVREALSKLSATPSNN